MPAELPRFTKVRQDFRGAPRESPLDEAVERELECAFAEPGTRIAPGSRVAVLVGSRGIPGLVPALQALGNGLRRRGCEPFIVPAMGSHGGGTPAGQEQALARLGVTESAVAMAVRSQGRVLRVAESDSGHPVFADFLAASADAILPVNRVAPHTNFAGVVESGLLKMLAIGLGKREAAESAHRAALASGLGSVVREVGSKALAALSVPFGLAILENARREAAQVAVVPGEGMEAAEALLLERARVLKPRLPFDFLHLLVVDSMGKNYSGTGMDTKIIGRMLLTGEAEPATPRYLRIYVRDLSEETGGNAHGMGLADFISRRLADKIDAGVTLANGLAACAPQRGRRPPVVDSDRDGFRLGLSTAGVGDPSSARIARIASTRDLERFWISESLAREASSHGLVIEEGPSEIAFDAAGDLLQPL
jgi:hypothetical protein